MSRIEPLFSPEDPRWSAYYSDEKNKISATFPRMQADHHDSERWKEIEISIERATLVRFDLISEKYVAAVASILESSSTTSHVSAVQKQEIVSAMLTTTMGMTKPLQKDALKEWLKDALEVWLGRAVHLCKRRLSKVRRGRGVGDGLRETAANLSAAGSSISPASSKSTPLRSSTHAMSSLQPLETMEASNTDTVDLMSLVSKESTPLSSLPSADVSSISLVNPSRPTPVPTRWSEKELEKMAELLRAQWEVESKSQSFSSASKLFTLISKQMEEAGMYRSMDGCRNQWYSVLSKQPQFQNTFSFSSNKSFESITHATPVIHDTGPAKTLRSWTDEEGNRLFELVKDRLEFEAASPNSTKLSKAKLFQLISKQLRQHGINRSHEACKRYWNRHGEETGLKLGFDDRDESDFVYEPNENEKGPAKSDTPSFGLQSSARTKLKSPKSKKKRAPIRFTDEQIGVLKKQAKVDDRPGKERRQQLAIELNDSVRRVTQFFNNWRNQLYSESKNQEPKGDLADVDDEEDEEDDGDDDDDAEESFISNRGLQTTRLANSATQEVEEAITLQSTFSPYGTRSSARKRSVDEVDSAPRSSNTPSAVPFSGTRKALGGENTPSRSARDASSSSLKNLESSEGGHRHKRPRTEERIVVSSHPHMPKKKASNPEPLVSSELSPKPAMPGSMQLWVAETEQQLLDVKNDLLGLEGTVASCTRSLKDDKNALIEAERKVLEAQKKVTEIRERMAVKERMIEDSNTKIEKLKPSQEKLEEVLAVIYR